MEALAACGLACIDCARITNHRVLFALTGFVISYTVLVYCILDLVWVNRMPYWATLSTVTFIVGLWAPSPGQGLASSKPSKTLADRIPTFRRRK